MKKKSRSHTVAQFCAALKKHNYYLLSCHVAPEGDAIGSMLAMDSLLRRLGKKTTVVCEDEFPSRLSFLSSRRWHTVSEIKKQRSRFDALLVTDCPTLARIGSVRDLITPETVKFSVDHHISNDYFADYNYVLPQSAASGEVVMDIFHYLKMKLTRDDATNLYTAISTDTGSFKHGNTSVQTHRCAAELIAAGVDIEKINEEIYATYSLNKINLYSRLFGRVQTTAHGKIAWVSMKRDDLQRTGATYEDTEGFIDFLKFLKEVKIAFFVTESLRAGEVKVSFRAKGSYDVNQIATHFGGGGHKKASGCTIRANAEDAEKLVLRELQRKFRFS